MAKTISIPIESAGLIDAVCKRITFKSDAVADAILRIPNAACEKGVKAAAKIRGKKPEVLWDRMRKQNPGDLMWLMGELDTKVPSGTMNTRYKIKREANLDWFTIFSRPMSKKDRLALSKSIKKHVSKRMIRQIAKALGIA